MLSSNITGATTGPLAVEAPGDSPERAAARASVRAEVRCAIGRLEERERRHRVEEVARAPLAGRDEASRLPDPEAPRIPPAEAWRSLPRLVSRVSGLP